MFNVSTKNAKRKVKNMSGLLTKLIGIFLPSFLAFRVFASSRECCSFLLLGVLLLQGCGDKGEVLAKVNGDAVTRADLEQTLERMLGDRTGEPMAPEVERKALESLVMTRAIAQRQEQAMADKERSLIENKVRRYREELLVEAYLRANAKPLAPTETDIAAYYAQHPEHFGAAPVRSYEILQSKSELNAEQTAKMLQSFTAAKQQRDWRAYAAELKKQGLPVVYVQGRSDGPAIEPRLLRTINGLSANQVSDVFYLDKQPHLVRVKTVETPPARPLEEVRPEIRKILATRQMRDSIKEIGEQVVGASDIEYINKE